MKQTLRDLLAHGKTKQVLDALRQLLPSDNDVVLLLARFEKMEGERHAGRLAHEPLSIEQNQINAAVLAMVDKLPDDGVSEQTRLGNFESSQNVEIVVNHTQNAEKIYNIQHIDNANFS